MKLCDKLRNISNLHNIIIIKEIRKQIVHTSRNTDSQAHLITMVKQRTLLGLGKDISEKKKKKKKKRKEK